jgi:cobyrinic acid a,c-diamide synthase
MNNFSKTKGFVLAAASSGAGKTTITSAICRILKNSGVTVQPFKTGPDFVDPTYLSMSSGRACRNLDGFPCPGLMPFFYEEGCRGGSRADIAVVEGAMGMYDGLGPDGTYSTAWLANKLGLPVILIVDARAAATSAAATVKGFAALEPLAPRVSGVIANRVSGEGHAKLIEEAVSRFTGIPLLGWIPNLRDEAFPSRHLGLVPAFERETTEAVIERFAGALREHLDVGRLLATAETPSGDYVAPDMPSPVSKHDGSRVRAAIADDDAFCFHYRENWRLLEQLGAEVAMISPIRGESIPEGTDLLILPGGYPEEFMAALSQNEKFIKSVTDFSKTKCIYAECGGMLYLSRSMEYGGETRNMAGALAADAKMTGKLSHFGYVEGMSLSDNLLMRPGETVRAHEFHYSKLGGATPNAFSVRKFARPEETWTDGYVTRDGRLLATYLHVNFYTRPESARRMLTHAANAADAFAGP